MSIASALPLSRPVHTFLGLPASEQLVPGSVSIFGAAHGTGYEHGVQTEGPELAPDAVRRAITAASVHIDHWDFDFDGPLLNDGALAVADLGNVQTQAGCNAANREAIEAVTRGILAAGSLPILVGGDDSVAIPFMRSFDDVGPLHILQIDAHIDWRDRIGHEPLGYSSTMRRASEIPLLRSMTQVGIRAVGSARREEVETARAWGSKIVTVRDLRARGIEAVVAEIPRDGRLLIHIDCDALDPPVCPGVNALSPGGLRLDEITDLIAAAMRERTLAGFSVVEFNPAGDVNDISATTVGRLVCHVLGNLARQGG